MDVYNEGNNRGIQWRFTMEGNIDAMNWQLQGNLQCTGMERSSWWYVIERLAFRDAGPVRPGERV